MACSRHALRAGLAKRAGLGHPGGVARSFRLVCEAPEIPGVEDLLRAQGFDFEPEPFHGLCRRLTREPFPLGASLAARFGLVYIQDRSSMLPPLALDPPPGAAVLDMCASPGGKTSFLAQLAGRRGFVLGNEPGADRLATLRQNLARMNLPQAATTGMKGQDLPLPEGSLGHILLDPPCSGWGTAEKNPRVLDLWTPDKALPLAALQRQLLAKAAALLAPGGRLLYSTCTTNRAENEEQVVWALEELGLELAPLAPFEGFSFHEPLLAGARGTLRVDGEGSEAQGFYLALFTRPGGGGGAQPVREEPPAAPARARGGKRAPRPAAGKGGCAEIPLEEAARLAPDLAWEALGPGWLELFKDEACFLPERGRGLLPPRRKGQRLGAIVSGAFRPWGRARFLVPPAGAGDGLDLHEPQALCALLEGQSLAVAPGPARRGLYFRGLPLGFLTVKGARALWSDR